MSYAHTIPDPAAGDVPSYAAGFFDVALAANHVGFELYDDRDSALTGLAVESYALLLADLRRRIAAAERSLVENLRTAGASWYDVGDILGISGDAAHERFGR